MNYNEAIEIAKDVYWVGANEEEAFLRTNAYLIKGENESVLIDPGSIPQFEIVERKVLFVVPKKHVKYVIASHQDPDVCSAIIPFAQHGFKFKTVAHSRVSVLLLSYDRSLDLYNIDENEFVLTYDNGKKLEFIFTPYFHSPGAFATYDPESKTLFTSDIFGAFQKDWELYANEKYIEPMKAFNELYAPSKEIVNNSIKKFRQKDVELIAPQHGSIIKKEYIETMYHALETMNAGIFLENAEINVMKMETMNEIPLDILNDILNIIKERAGAVMGKEAVQNIVNSNLPEDNTPSYNSIMKLINNIKEKNPIAIAIMKTPLVNYVMDNSTKLKEKAPNIVKEIIYM
jgi:flavorubredoxin